MEVIPIEPTPGRRFSQDLRLNEVVVLQEIQRWWDSSLLEDRDNNQELDEHEYANLYQRIVYAFNHDGDPRTDLDVLQAKESLKMDFENDSEGDGAVCKKDFHYMIFELADTWAEDCDGDGSVNCIDMAEYLKELHEKVFGVEMSEVEDYWNSHVGCTVRSKTSGKTGVVTRNVGSGKLEVQLESGEIVVWAAHDVIILEHSSAKRWTTAKNLSLAVVKAAAAGAAFAAAAHASLVASAAEDVTAVVVERGGKVQNDAGASDDPAEEAEAKVVEAGGGDESAASEAEVPGDVEAAAEEAAAREAAEALAKEAAAKKAAVEARAAREAAEASGDAEAAKEAAAKETAAQEAADAARAAREAADAAAKEAAEAAAREAAEAAAREAAEREAATKEAAITTKQPVRPPGTKPTAPSGTKPTAPSGTKPTAPSGTKPTAPSGTKATARSTRKPAMRRTQQQTPSTATTTTTNSLKRRDWNEQGTVLTMSRGGSKACGTAGGFIVRSKRERATIPTACRDIPGLVVVSGLQVITAN
jgi:hypothetical protein